MMTVSKIKDYLYPDAQTIAVKAEQYDKVPWYGAPRFVPFAVWAAAAVLTTLLGQEDSFEAFSIIGGLLSVALPLSYLGIKGNRGALALAALQIFSAQLTSVWQSGWNAAEILSAPVAAAVFVAPIITAFRIENYRHKNKMLPKQKNLADLAKALCLAGIIIVLAILHGHVQTQKELASSEKLMAEYIFISRHTEDISAFCRKHGVELKKYPRRFKRDYAAKIAEVDGQMAGKKYIKSGLDKILRESRAAKADEMFERDRRAVIVMELRKQKGSDAVFAWKEEYDALMSKSAYCRFVDEHYDWIKSLGVFGIMEQ